MSGPLISFIVCNYNYSEFLESSIRSAMEQTYKNILIVVIDDASTDNSREIIERLAREDSRIIPIYNNIGVGAAEARNIGIRAVWDKTDFFQILDADDEARHDKVEILLSKALLSPMIGAVYADYDVLNVQTGNLTREYKESYSLSNLMRNCIVHSASLISKNAFAQTAERDEDGQISFYDKRLHGHVSREYIGSCEDYDAFIRISEKFLFLHIPKPLSLVRVHKNNASQIEKVNKVWESNCKLMQDKAKQRLVNRKS